MVTSGDDGMAVPDWPTTYGYNMFLYPLSTWLSGPWGVFIEHSHRLLGASVGACSLVLAASLWLCGAPRYLRWLGVGVVLAVSSQGVLGGMRVVMDERLLAKIHACTGPIVFALVVVVAQLVGRWRAGTFARVSSAVHAWGATYTRARLSAYAVVVLAYVQLMLGAQLRHLSIDSGVSGFRVMVVFHVFLAVVLAAYSLGLSWRVRRSNCDVRREFRPAYWLAGCVALQLLLGVGTWIVNYGWPVTDTNMRWAAGFVVIAESTGQVVTTTAHVAMGSLILALAATVALRAAVSLPAATAADRTQPQAVKSPPFRLEVAV